MIVPLYGQKVEIRAHELAQPDKGTGIAMICTFGDTTDVTWWRELQLGLRVIIGRDGRLLPDAPADVDPEAYALIAGKYPNQAQRAVVEQLTEQGILIGEPRPDAPGQVLREAAIARSRSSPRASGTSATAARDADLRAALVDARHDVIWHPDHMRHRYENWVEGLNGDWLDQPPAVLRRAGSRSGTRSTTPASPATTRR